MLTRIVNRNLVHGTIWAKIDSWLIKARQKPFVFTGLHFYYFIYNSFVSIRPLVSENLLFVFFSVCSIPFSSVIYLESSTSLRFTLVCVLGNLQAVKERAAVTCLYLHQGLPYNQVICVVNDVVAFAAMVPFISLAHWMFSLLKSGLPFLFCLKYYWTVSLQLHADKGGYFPILRHIYTVRLLNAFFQSYTPTSAETGSLR